MFIQYLFTDYLDIVVGVAVNIFALHLSILDIYPAGTQLFDILFSQTYATEFWSLMFWFRKIPVAPERSFNFLGTNDRDSLWMQYPVID